MINRNIKWQILNKIKKEGWVPAAENRIRAVLNVSWKFDIFYSPDLRTRLEFSCWTSNIRYAIVQPHNQYKVIHECSYKDFLKNGSSGILVEALL